MLRDLDTFSVQFQENAEEEIAMNLIGSFRITTLHYV